MLRAPLLSTLRRRTALAVALLASVCALSDAASAQYAEGGARSLAMGRTGVASGGLTWGQANPATWATAERGLGLEASQAYGLGELRLAGASASLPLALGTLAATGRTYGTDGYSETRLMLGLGRTLPLSSTRRLSVGVALGYDALSIDEFGSRGTVALSLGMQGEVVPGLRAGLALKNALGLADDAEADLTRPLGAVPSVAAGLEYAPSDRSRLALDVVQDMDGALAVRAGLEAQIVDALALRGGVGTAPVTYSAGVGIAAGPVRADLGVELHQALGLTPAVSLQTQF